MKLANEIKVSLVTVVCILALAVILRTHWDNRFNRSDTGGYWSNKGVRMMPPPDSAATSLPRLASLGHLTADKSLRYASPKLPSATSFIRKTLSGMAGLKRNIGR